MTRWIQHDSKSSLGAFEIHCTILIPQIGPVIVQSIDIVANKGADVRRWTWEAGGGDFSSIRCLYGGNNGRSNGPTVRDHKYVGIGWYRCRKSPIAIARP